MRVYPILAIIALLISSHGFCIYHGIQIGEGNRLEDEIQNTDEALKDRDNADQIVNRTDDIDALLNELGIMRPDADR